MSAVNPNKRIAQAVGAKPTVSDPVAIPVYLITARSYAARMPTSRFSRSGFTLIELVMVLVLIGALAVAALPRFFDRNTFNSRGFYDQTLSILRYAQKAAIAQRRTVCVAFTASSVVLTMAPSAGSSSCSVNLSGPNGGAPFTINASAGVTFSPTVPTNFNFDSIGRASLGQSNLQISNASGTISIEAETGYVHR